MINLTVPILDFGLKKFFDTCPASILDFGLDDSAASSLLRLPPTSPRTPAENQASKSVCLRHAVRVRRERLLD